MRLSILAVGRIKERGIREAVDDYLSRIGRYAPVSEIELKDGPPTRLDEAFSRRVEAGCHAVALEPEGKAFTSEGFARWLERVSMQGKGETAFLIGGADGLPAPVRARAQERLSLSPMTLPHRLARLLLVEQLYRAMTILRGEPYSR